MAQELGENQFFEGDMAMFVVGFGSHHGSRWQFFGCVILKWHITHLMDGKNGQCSGIF
jgi:hypothetical protein